jgi:UDP-N-acetylmuramoyl-tripeptide--D-alanyl-D-alanine ligase
MMWSSAEIARAVKGKELGGFTASSVAIDSRKSAPGALFFALKGERADGHEYVKEVLAKGAAGALVSRVPSGLDANAPLVVAKDVQQALGDLAIAARERTHAKIIAVTGSVGKTGTKEAIRTALAAVGQVYATQGNLNNHIGLPLSLANLPAQADYGVFELGMNHAGELSQLTRIARPDIAIITNVEAVHLEFFSGVEAIADAKAEIMEGLQEGGTLILNHDNPHYGRLLNNARAHNVYNVVTFGAHEEAQCRLVSYRMIESGSEVEAVIHGTPMIYRLGTTGRHWAITSLAALAASVAAGADLATAAAALEHFSEPDGRGRLQRVMLPDGFVTLIDDCYNASPASTKAAIAKLAEVKAAQGGAGRSVAVLGDMLELGISAPMLHEGLLSPLSEHGIDKAYLAGPLMKNLYDALPVAARGAHAGSAAALAPLLAPDLRAGDVVLIKGSRGSRMDIVRDVLLSSTARPVKESIHAV